MDIQICLSCQCLQLVGRIETEYGRMLHDTFGNKLLRFMLIPFFQRTLAGEMDLYPVRMTRVPHRFQKGHL